MSRPARTPDPEAASEATLRAKTARLVERFEEERGPHRWPGPRDPVAGIVQTLLSHNTTDPNAFSAYDRLSERYGGWDAVRTAPTDELAETIRVAGLHNQKAERIQRFLSFLREEQGSYGREAFEGLDFEGAMETFGHLPGVKHKTLSVVLAFDLGHDLFPVDTHVHRVVRRLGLVPEGYDPVKTFKAMQPLVPEGKGYQFHIHLIRHGRSTCTARKPACGECFVRDECRYYALQGSDGGRGKDAKREEKA